MSVSSADLPPHPQLSVGLDAGNDGLQRASLCWHAPWADGDGGVLVDGVHVDADGFRDHSASRQVTGQAVLKGGFGDGGRYSVLLNTHDLPADDPQALTAAQLRVDRRAAIAGALNFDTRQTAHQDRKSTRLHSSPYCSSPMPHSA